MALYGAVTVFYVAQAQTKEIPMAAIFMSGSGHLTEDEAAEIDCTRWIIYVEVPRFSPGVLDEWALAMFPAPAERGWQDGLEKGPLGIPVLDPAEAERTLKEARSAASCVVTEDLCRAGTAAGCCVGHGLIRAKEAAEAKWEQSIVPVKELLSRTVEGFHSSGPVFGTYDTGPLELVLDEGDLSVRARNAYGHYDDAINILELRCDTHDGLWGAVGLWAQAKFEEASGKTWREYS